MSLSSWWRAVKKKTCSEAGAKKKKDEVVENGMKKISVSFYCRLASRLCV